MEKKKAPFTEEQVCAFNASQKDPMRHPYTCCSEGSADKCERRLGISNGNLIATTEGLICPCGEVNQNKIGLINDNKQLEK